MVAPHDETHLDTHVVVVGSGAAGLCAAIEAAESGARVMLIEKHKIGGNSAKATSGINGAGTSVQRALGIEDRPEAFMQDTLVSGEGMADEQLVARLAHSSASAVEWLISLGVNLTQVERLGGHSTARSHRIPPLPDGRPVPVGWTTISALVRKIKDFGDRITVMEGYRLLDIIISNDAQPSLSPSPHLPGHAAEGVVIQATNTTADDSPAAPPLTIHSDSVVLATGGFSSDALPQQQGQGDHLPGHLAPSLLKEVAPLLAHHATTNGLFATGDSLKIGQHRGLAMKHLEHIQLHPTGFVDLCDPLSSTKWLAPEMLRGCGAILVTHTGERFVNELEKRSVVSDAILQGGTPILAWPGMEGARLRPDSGEDEGAAARRASNSAALLMNEAIRQRVGAGTLRFYEQKGLIRSAGSLREAAAMLGVREDRLIATIKDYSNGMAQGKDSFGKSVFPAALSPDDTFYIAIVTPCLHYTMGGLCVNSSAQVMREEPSAVVDPLLDLGVPTQPPRRPVSGLFAAGEVVGGLHGANRLAGNGLLESVVFGRLAGNWAARSSKRSSSTLPLPIHPGGESAELRLREIDDRTIPGCAVLRFDLPSGRHVANVGLGGRVLLKPPHCRNGVSLPVLTPPSSFTGVLELALFATVDGDTDVEQSPRPPPLGCVCAPGSVVSASLEPPQEGAGDMQRLDRMVRKDDGVKCVVAAGNDGLALALQLMRYALHHHDTLRGMLQVIVISANCRCCQYLQKTAQQHRSVLEGRFQLQAKCSDEDGCHGDVPGAAVGDGLWECDGLLESVQLAKLMAQQRLFLCGVGVKDAADATADEGARIRGC
ncbi:unnamed protein product [Vitrella brassicaformis CCMP3155]|uniref:FAD-dependent oxidoreductase 2 FAD-binding domain-containing protein n=3 Tax=Vitrella brassicaformis TaxID=1169539 RepID=A0A0G4EA39_VITBC|nr:unnamed protein product [Vitrella brassicaformis CCMP3155]|mmetsp:Transcript_45403/g.128115  ORF Transcript_45403/g.128115 Transcript_45403/m.128115 type:complete len:827 (-) Transcript_45403:1093-3573(-)|eukprot:CEL92101.1 unnamed protein product [Vitrella brassicaformis CCMP3155]